MTRGKALKTLEPARVRCDLCGGGDLEFLVTQPLVGHGRLRRCQTCGLVTLSREAPVPADYWEEDACGLDVYGDPAYLAEVERRYRQYLALIAALHRGPGVLLDAGCGPGNFLRVARALGWKVYGVDISEKAAAQARTFGLEVETAHIEKVPWPDQFFDVITLWDVIEHLDSPRRAVEAAYRKLRRGGVLFLETPDEGFWIRRVLVAAHRMSAGRIQLSRYFYYPDHCVYFTATTITALLTKIGFRILRVVRDVTPISKAYLKISPWAFPLKRLILTALPLTFGILTRLGKGNKLIVLARKP